MLQEKSSKIYKKVKKLYHTIQKTSRILNEYPQKHQQKCWNSDKKFSETP